MNENNNVYESNANADIYLLFLESRNVLVQTEHGE